MCRAGACARRTGREINEEVEEAGFVEPPPALRQAGQTAEQQRCRCQRSGSEFRPGGRGKGEHGEENCGVEARRERSGIGTGARLAQVGMRVVWMQGEQAAKAGVSRRTGGGGKDPERRRVMKPD